MTPWRASSALVATFVLVASARPARAQDAAAMQATQTPIVEPLPMAAPRAPSPPTRTPALSPAQPHLSHEPFVWLAAPGVALFALSYGLAFIIGGVLALTPSPAGNSVSNDIACDSSCHDQAALLMVPVAGPLLSFQLGPHNSTDTKIGIIWSGIEAAGAAMLIVGLIGHDVSREPIPTLPRTRVSIVPFVTPDGGMLALRTPW